MKKSSRAFVILVGYLIVPSSDNKLPESSGDWVSGSLRELPLGRPSLSLLEHGPSDGNNGIETGVYARAAIFHLLSLFLCRT